MKSINATLRSELRRFFYNLVLLLLGIYPLFWFLRWIECIFEFECVQPFKLTTVPLVGWDFLLEFAAIPLLIMLLMMHATTYKLPKRWAASLSMLLFWMVLFWYTGGYVFWIVGGALLSMSISLVLFVMFYRLPPVPSEKNP